MIVFHKRLYEVTYFEEREEALFIQTIHVTFLKQLEVGDITHHYNHNNNHNTLTFW